MAQAEAGEALSHLNDEIVASLDDFHDPGKSGAASFGAARNVLPRPLPVAA